MSDVTVPTLAAMLACDEIMKTGASHEDALTAAECALGAAAPLIIAAYLDGIGREFWRDSHISKVCRDRASVLRGEGQT